MAKRILNLVALIVFIFLFSYVFAEKYEYSDESGKKRLEKKNSEELARNTALIGKKFWIDPKPNESEVYRVEFEDTPDLLSRKFYVGSITSFEIIDLIKSENPYLPGDYSFYFKVRFEDGKECFIFCAKLWINLIPPIDDNLNYDLERILNTRDEKIYEEYPVIVKARIEKKIAELKAKAKKAKGKGGVKLDMTKEEVLKSSWGKPKKINTTIVKGLTHEQWIYDGGFLYFENGILTGIQK